MPSRFYYIDLESVDAGELTHLKVVNKSDAPSRAQRVVKANDILYQTVRPYQQNNYLVTNECNLPVVASTGYAQIRTQNNPQFLYDAFHTRHFVNEVLLRCTGSNYPAINSSDLKEVEVRITDIAEQNKIAAFMQMIDLRIRKQRQLVKSLKLYKRGVSTALFERKINMKKPVEISFEEWEKTTLGDVFLERNERASGSEKLLAVTINGGVQDRSNLNLKDNSSENKNNYRKVYVDDIAYNTMRMWQGACGISAYDGIVSPAYTVIYAVDNTKYNSRYWAYLFKEVRMMRLFQRNSQGLTSDTWNLKYDKFSKIAVEVPSYAEQVAIADFLDSVSHLITIHEDSLRLLQYYKRSLLSQMFI